MADTIHMDWKTFRSSPHLVLGAAIVLAAIIVGSVTLNISHDNRCRPVAVQKQSLVSGDSYGNYGDGGSYEVLEKPPGC